MNVEFQMRTEAMHVVAESGVAAHWLYKASEQDGEAADRLGTKWLQSLLDIQDETRDAAEFWDHVKIDLFPDAVYVFTPKSQIMALPRGATVVDFAYAIHSNIGDRTVAAKINGVQVPLRTELKNGDVVEVVTAPVSTPNPAWLGFVRTGRARSKIRHHLKTLAQAESQDLGEKLLTQALRAEGLERLPADDEEHKAIWEKLLRFTGSRSRAELLTDIGLGKRIASIVAKRLMTMLAERGEKPDALLITRERYTAHENVSQGEVILDGSENASVQFATCCRPVPGDAHRRLPGPRRGPGRAHRRLRGGQAPAAQGQRALHQRRMGGRAGAAVRDRPARHRGQRQGRARARGRGARQRRGRHRARGHGRRAGPGRDRPALHRRGAGLDPPRSR